MGVHCCNLTKTYSSRSHDLLALENVSFSVGDHEFVCVVGPSGCGKTTLLNVMAGLIKPTTGEVVFRPEFHDNRLTSALVFQEHGLFPWMDVVDNVAFGLEMQGVDRSERRARALGFIERFGLLPFAGSYPHALSVGMRQRAGIARAFLADPYLLLMDEPFGSLDAQTKLILQEELLKIWKDYQKAVVYVTHDIEEAVLLGDRVLVLSGRPARILEDIPVPLGRPRDLILREQPEVKRIQKHIWRLLEGEVRKRLALAD